MTTIANYDRFLQEVKHGCYFFNSFVFWTICLTTTIYVDSLKKYKTQKSFRIYKRVLSVFLICVGFVVWLVSLDNLFDRVGIICTIVSNVILLVATILLFINVKRKNFYNDIKAIGDYHFFIWCKVFKL